MRSEEEINRVFMEIGEDDMLSIKENRLINKGDNFKWGCFIGKLIALEWVLGGKSGDMSNHYDFEDYELETLSYRGTIPPPNDTK